VPRSVNDSQVEPAFLTVRQASIVFQRTEGAIRKMIAAGLLPAVRLGPRGTRVPRRVIDEMIEKAMKQGAR
jgi:excisionase family DNA binding protein